MANEPTVNMKLDIDSPATLQQINDYLADAATFDLEERAHILVQWLTIQINSRLTPEDRQKLERRYHDTLKLAIGVSLTYLSEDEIVAYCKSGIEYALRRPDIDLNAKIRAKLNTILMLEDRDEYKKKLRGALRENTERLTLKSMRTSIGMLPGTVRSWIEIAEKLRPYPTTLLKDVIVDDENYIALPDGDKQVVMRLLELDSLIAQSSMTPEGFEGSMTVNDNGKLFIVENGEIEAISPEVEELYKMFMSPDAQAGKVTVSSLTTNTVEKPKTVVDQVREINEHHRSEDEQRYARQEKMLQDVNSDMNAVVSHLSNGIIARDKDTVITSLSVLGRFGEFGTALQNGQLAQAFESTYLPTLAGFTSMQDIGAIRTTNATNPVLIAAFIQWALLTVLGENLSESARVGNQIGTLLAALGSPEFSLMTYFDASADMYRWTSVKIRPGGRLEWITPVAHG